MGYWNCLFDGAGYIERDLFKSAFNIDFRVKSDCHALNRILKSTTRIVVVKVAELIPFKINRNYTQTVN